MGSSIETYVLGNNKSSTFIVVLCSMGLLLCTSTASQGSGRLPKQNTFEELRDDFLNISLSPSLRPDSPSRKNLIQVPGDLISLLDPPDDAALQRQLSKKQIANGIKLKNRYQGIATISSTRNVDTFGGQQMSCGMGYLNDYFTDHFVGIGPALYGKGLRCGMCIRLWCVDSICPDALLKNRLFMITEKCDACSSFDIIASANGMEMMTTVDANINPSLQVAWEFASCAPLIEGDIKLLPSSSNTKKKVGINFSNIKVPIVGVKMNNYQMQPGMDGYWTLETNQEAGLPLRPPYTLLIRGATGEILEFEVARLIPQSLGKNFKAA